MMTIGQRWTDPEIYTPAEAAEERRQQIKQMDERFSEAPSVDSDAVDALAPRFRWDLPMIWTARKLAYFFGGTRHDDQCSDNKTRQQAGEHAGD